MDTIIYKLEEIRTRLFGEADEQDGLGQAEVLAGNVVKEHAQRGMAAGLRLAAGIIAEEIEDEREWNRINSLTKEQLSAELLKAGYTEERLNASFERFRAMLEKHGAKQAVANTKFSGAPAAGRSL